jgi:hypothetical protein
MTTVHRMPFSLLLSLPFAALTACGPKVTNQNIEALNSQFEQGEKTGKAMSLKEVESIMGPPTRIESFPIEMRTVKELPGVRYYYEQDGQTVVLHFIDNKLIRRALKFGEDLSEEKDRPGFMTPLRPLPGIDAETPEPDAATPRADSEQPAPALPDKAN